MIAFVFSQSTVSINNQQYLINCPYPILNGTVTNADIVPPPPNGVRVTYNVTYPSTTGAFFNCFINAGGLPSLQVIAKPYGSTTLNFPNGWFQWLGDTLTTFFAKAQPTLTMIYLLFVLPAQVTGIAWFTYINIMLVIMIILGIIMLVRG